MHLKRLAIAVALTALAGPAVTAQARVVCTAFADASNGKLLLSEGDCTTRVSPASTFKVAISLMGYDSGFLKDEHAPALPYKDGYLDWNKDWKHETDPQRWMKLSVVWYSQQVMRSLGEAGAQRYLDKFDYGNRDISGDPGEHNSLTTSWIGSSLKISPLEQLAFLGKIVNRTLPVSAHAYDMTTHLLLQDQRPDGWELHAKTGSASDNGWYVGWASKGGRTLLFARLIHDDQDYDTPRSVRVREGFQADLPGLVAKIK